MRETLGQYIQRKRESLGLSQRALAKKAKVSPNTLSRIEAEEGKPNSETLERLADALGLPLSKLTDALQGRITKDDKHPIVNLIERLPSRQQKVVENIIRILVEDYELNLK